MRNETVVLGLGNPLMADEGIGNELLELLQSTSESCSVVDFLDAGTGGMSLLYHFEGRKKVIIIDCAFMGETPGTIKRFTPAEVQTVKKLGHLSLHEVDILKVIELAKQLDQCPEEIVFYAIEPEKVSQQQHLSKTLQAKLPEYAKQIRSELINQ